MRVLRGSGKHCPPDNRLHKARNADYMKVLVCPCAFRAEYVVECLACLEEIARLEDEQARAVEGDAEACGWWTTMMLLASVMLPQD